MATYVVKHDGVSADHPDADAKRLFLGKKNVTNHVTKYPDIAKKTAQLLKTKGFQNVRVEQNGKPMNEENDLQEFVAYIGKVMKDGHHHTVWQKAKGGYDYEIQDRVTGKTVKHYGDLEDLDKKGYHWVNESIMSFGDFVNRKPSDETKQEILDKSVEKLKNVAPAKPESTLTDAEKARANRIPSTRVPRSAH